MSGRGTRGQPFSLTEALALTSANFPVPGNTLEIERNIAEDATGGAGLPAGTIIKATNRATLNGSITCNGNSITFRDMIIYDADLIDRTIDQVDLPNGFRVDNPGAEINLINCVLHDLNQAIIIASSYNVLIYGCVIYNIGWAEWPGGGHGVYASNQSETASHVLKHNIIAPGYAFGIHSYQSGGWNYNAQIIENIAFCAGELLNTPSCNILLGCDGAAWPIDGVISGNACYHRSFAAGGVGIRLGQGAAGSQSCAVTGNYCAGGQYPFMFIGDNWGENTVKQNTFVGTPYNAAYFLDNTTLADFPATGSKVFVYPNEYETGRAHVAIFNWSGGASATVDLSTVTGLSVGDDVTFANAQGLFVDIQTLTLDENMQVSVDMQAANRTVTAPQGADAPATTAPRFGAWLVRKA